MSTPKVVLDSTTGRRDGPSSPPLACSWTVSSPGTAWIRLAGVLDFMTVAQLARSLQELGERALLVLDMRELDSIDFFGVHAIANASNRAREIGGRLVLLRAAQDVDHMFVRAGRLGDVEIGELKVGEPSTQALRRLAAEEAG